MENVRIAVKVVNDNGIFMDHIYCSEKVADIVRLYARGRRYQNDGYFWSWIEKVEKMIDEKLDVRTSEFLKNFGSGDDEFNEEAYEG